MYTTRPKGSEKIVNEYTYRIGDETNAVQC